MENSTKTLCFGRKKQQELCLIKSVSTERNVFWSHFYQNKVFLFKFFIKFYWNKCVSVNILIWQCKISIKTLCFGRKKQQELCLIKKCFCNIFIKFYQNKCVSVSILICAWKNSTKTLCFGRKKTARTVLDQKCFCHIFIKFYWNKCVSWSIF